MATLVLPADPSLSAYSFEVELEGALYRFLLEWNDRDGAWFVSVLDRAGAPLVSGRRIVLGADLLGPHPDPAAPPGMVLVVDSSGANADPGRSDLGARCPLLYIESTGP